MFRAGGSGSSCPSGSQYKGNGFCSSSDGRQYFRVVEIAEALVLQVVSTKAMDSANQMITNNSFLVVDLAEHLALLGLSTKGMVSAKAINKQSDRKT